MRGISILINKYLVDTSVSTIWHRSNPHTVKMFLLLLLDMYLSARPGRYNIKQFSLVLHLHGQTNHKHVR